MTDTKCLEENYNNNDEIYEICIICKKITDVEKTTHIDFRFGYIDGAGQLCRECAKK